jgi:hypothetical protein
MKKTSIIASAVGALCIAASAASAQTLKGPTDDSALSWAPSKWGKDDRAGSSNHTKNPANVKKALATIKQFKTITIGKYYHREAPAFGPRSWNMWIPGTPTGGPQADTWDNPKWQTWVKAYQDAFPADKRFAIPSLSATNYYNAANAIFTALNKINGDLSDGHKKLRATLASLEIDAPNGKIKLDNKRHAIAANFVTEVVEAPNGDLVNKMVKFVPETSQLLGFSEEAFAKLGEEYSKRNFAYAL